MTIVVHFTNPRGEAKKRPLTKDEAEIFLVTAQVPVTAYNQDGQVIGWARPVHPCDDDKPETTSFSMRWAWHLDPEHPLEAVPDA